MYIFHDFWIYLEDGYIIEIDKVLKCENACPKYDWITDLDFIRWGKPFKIT